ncbi:MAG: Gfo/Idh/MocA family oxidoreductase [Candidatus Omnitrophica bacterium]|nr:Gfo/Idh/MocA family oxidoreductase [Candidatus Omnitrophota bacterium]
MEKVKIGVIGVGGMGIAHCNMVKEIPEAQLTAVSDANKTAAEKAGKDFAVQFFSDYKELIRSGLVDAIIIATPHYFHPEVAVFAMENGLHVLTEKPISVSVSQADKMVSTAKKTGKTFSIVYQRRTEPFIRAAIDIAKSGKLGDIHRTLCVDSWYRTQAYYNSGSWRATWAGEGGGILINQSPHTIDLFILLGGMPKKIEGKVRTRFHKIEVEDEASALLEYENGAWGYYYATTNEFPEGFHIEIVGEKGKLEINTPNEIKFYSFSRGLTEFMFASDKMWDKLDINKEKIELIDLPSGHKVIIQNFCRAILFNEPLISPGEDGIKAIEFINSVIYSGMKNKKIELPLNRKSYDKLLSQLQASSKQKENVKETRETDPQHKK